MWRSSIAGSRGPIRPTARPSSRSGSALRASQAAAQTLGLELRVLNASTEREFDGVFANLIQLRAGGLVISGGPFFSSRQEQLAALPAAGADIEVRKADQPKVKRALHKIMNAAKPARS
jgi:hypothetical protein